MTLFYALEALKGFFMIKVEDLKMSCFAISRLRTTPYHSMTNGFNFNPNAVNTDRKKQTKLAKLIYKLIYTCNCTRHSVTGFSPFYLMFGRNARLLIDFLIENNTDEQNTPTAYIEKWKIRMKEAFGIAPADTKRRRDMDRRKRDQKARLEPLEVGGRVLVRNLNGPDKIRAFWEQKVCKILEKKDEDGLVYAVREESDPHAQVRVPHRNNLLSCQEFQGFENTNM